MTAVNLVLLRVRTFAICGVKLREKMHLKTNTRIKKVRRALRRQTEGTQGAI
jgi:hypothetical protein